MPQILPTKEASLFRQLVKFYESKQHKKGIKAADQILKKHPNHGDTQSMKALILNSQGHGEEAFALSKLALKNDMKSHVCWHVYGLLWRSVKNYEEAVKAYKFALRIEPESQNILRDLALLQCQIRDFEGYIDSRKKILNARSALRQNWTGLAIAYHLAGNYKEAEHILTTYEETLKQPPSRSDIEHSEAVLYKNTIIAESGDTERALKHLEGVMAANLDKTAVLELKAKYLLQLDRKEEAAKTYRALLDRNSDYRAYYDGLEKALGLDKRDDASIEKLTELYESYASKNERSDAPRRIPLDFLKGDAFKAAADKYLQQKLNKGVPSTFPNIKALYADSEKKAIIEELVLGYASEKPMNGSAEGKTESKSRFEDSVIYFLAQHYTYVKSRNLEKAMEYIERLIEKDPKSVDYNQMKARIYKNYGNTQEAADTMNHARELDLKDRYINTKCAKYQLRNNENEKALDTMSKFTRNEAVGGPLGDLHDMQCMWYLLEDGEAYLRRGNIALALKRFTAIADIFEVWQEDQFDFHSFSLRKGQIRAYIDMVRWEDSLRAHPFFTRAALSAVKLYLRLYDNPDLARGRNAELDKMEPLERKKALKKMQREEEKLKKAEAERKAAAQAKATPKADDGDAKKEDTDPKGEKLLQTKEPLEVALRFLTPILEQSPRSIEGQDLGFQVYLRRNKPLLALKCYLAAKELDPEYPGVHKNAILLRNYLNNLKEPLASPIASSIEKEFDSSVAKADAAALKAANDEFIKKHSSSPLHLLAAYVTRQQLDSTTQSQNETDLQKILDLDDITIAQAATGLELLDEWKSEAKIVDAYREAAAKKWPQATRFAN